MIAWMVRTIMFGRAAGVMAAALTMPRALSALNSPRMWLSPVQFTQSWRSERMFGGGVLASRLPKM